MKQDKVVSAIIGSAFLLCSAILFAAKYIAASIVLGMSGYMPILLNAAVLGTLVVGIIIVLSLLEKSSVDKDK